MSDKMDTSNTSNEGQNSSLLENENTPKDNKNKRSKRWRKKSSKKESSQPQKDFAESGKEHSDLTDDQTDDKAKGKEKKSLKGRIKKMSLRKLSKQDKKNYAEIAEENEKQEKTIDEKDAKQEDEKMAVEDEESKPGASGVENESKDINDKSEGTEKEEGVRGTECEEKNDKEKKEEEDCISEEDDIAETSTEIRQKEDEERRKSRDNFDAVVLELETKGPKDQNNSATPAEGDNAENVEDAVKEKETSTATKQAAAKESELDEIVKIENVDGGDFIDEFELLNKEDDDEMIADDRPDIEENEKPLLEAEIQTKQEDEKQADPTNNEDEVEENAKPDNETEGTKEFGPIKGENLDLSQKIARKAVGKVVGRYRQVHLTKTYCQCCSVM